jgi:hypothetical protein
MPPRGRWAAWSEWVSGVWGNEGPHLHWVVFKPVVGPHKPGAHGTSAGAPWVQ